MDLLILGGTKFLGRHLVDAALARGHRVTLFNRGRQDPAAYPDVEQLRGDRNGALDALRGRRWDACVDPSGYIPRIVRDSARLLAPAVGHYTFVSTVSVYADNRHGYDESGPVGAITPEQLAEMESTDLKDPVTAKNFGELYGPLKARCERAVEEELPGRALVVRPGLIVGPFDLTDRFGYWVRRVAQGGEVLAPGRPERVIQIIDACDLAEWTIAMSERRATGVFNATGPDRALPMGEVLDACRAAGGSDATFTWVSETFLAGQQVAPWSEMPLWIPEEPEMAGFFETAIARALAAGLTFRPLATTVGDSLAWERTRPADTQFRAGITRERERELLEAWKRAAPVGA